MKIGMFKISLRRLGVFVIIGVVLVLVLNFNTRLVELARLQNEVATVRAQATGVIVTQEVLQTQIAVATSPAAVPGYARGEAHMGKEGDNIIVVLPAAGSTPEPLPTPRPAVNDLTPWQVWMLFIFGK